MADLGGSGESGESGESGKLLRLVGLGARGRLVVVGVDRVREAAFGGDLRLAVVAADAAANSRGKIVPLLRGRGITMIETASSSELGHAVGRASAAVVGVLDVSLARGIKAADEDGEILGE